MALLHGHPVEAAGYNYLLPFAVAYLGLLGAHWLFPDSRRVGALYRRLTTPFALMFVAVVTVVWVVARNIGGCRSVIIIIVVVMMFVMFMVFMLLIVFHLVVVFIKLFDVVIIIIIVVVCGREKHYRNGLGGMPDSFPIALYRLFVGFPRGIIAIDHSRQQRHMHLGWRWRGRHVDHRKQRGHIGDVEIESVGSGIY